jgi:hypothetical protein
MVDNDTFEALRTQSLLRAREAVEMRQLGQAVVRRSEELRRESEALMTQAVRLRVKKRR